MRAFLIFCVITLTLAENSDSDLTPTEDLSSELSFASDPVQDAPLSNFNSPFRFADTDDKVSSSGNFASYQTEFYSFTVPEEIYDYSVDVQNVLAHLKPKVRVVFIQNPTNKAYENAVLALSKQAAEQKTVIYVFNREHDLSALAEEFEVIHNSVNRKPEVNFVKYRAPEDAVNAQRAIQDQYDFGSFSTSSNSVAEPVPNLTSDFNQDSYQGSGSGSL